MSSLSKQAKGQSSLCQVTRITGWVQPRSIGLDSTDINAWLAWGYVSLERRAWDRAVAVRDVDVVWAGHWWHVRDLTGAVLVVLALNRGLGRTFHRQSQPTWALLLSRVNSEHRRLVSLATLQAWTISLDLGRALDSVDLEWRVGHGLATVRNFNTMGARLQEGKGRFGSVPCWGGGHVQHLVGGRHDLHLGLCLRQTTRDDSYLPWLSNGLGYTHTRWS